MGMKYEAVLKRGNSYTVFGTTFLKNVPSKRLLSQSERDYLEQNAIYVVKTTDGERIPTCMFEFVSRPDAATADDYEEDEDLGGEGDGGEGGEGDGGGTGEDTPDPNAGGNTGEGGEGGGPNARVRAR